MPPRSRLLGSVISKTRARLYSAPAERSTPAAKLKYLPTKEGFKPPKGFLAGSAFAGVKASNTKYDDVALIVSEKPSVAAAVTTRNIFKAAPVKLCKAILQKRTTGFHGVVINSGCANAVTGKEGLKHAVQMAVTADAESGTTSREEAWTAETVPRTLVMSTGVIGQKLPIEKITQAIPKAHAVLGSSYDHWMSAARAICTTDTFPKLLSRSFKLPSHPDTEYRIAGMTKGAGMIHPNMGTLLGVVCTDVSVNDSNLRMLLQKATNRSFNSISIDGDTSTNDTVAFFANGVATPRGVQPLDFAERKLQQKDGHKLSEDEATFYSTLTAFMKDLAKLVVRDGEGATKFITIRVQSAASTVVARRVAASIGTSALVKTALYGKDANWGRIICAAGYAAGNITDTYRNFRSDHGRPIDPYCTSVSLVPADGSPSLDLLINGEPQAVDEVRAKEILEHEDIEIFVKLGQLDETGVPFPGKHYSAKFYTCDFSVSPRSAYAQDIH